MKNATIEFFPDQENSEVLGILMKGDLTIDNIKEFKTQILEQIKDKTTIALKTEDVQGVDLPFYQFILSLKNTLESQNQELTLSIRLPEDKEALFVNSGLDLNFN